MIDFKSLKSEKPYIRYKEFYDLALKNNQNQIEKILIASFDKFTNEVNARYVNLKYIDQDQWIFFSNYNSTKAQEFSSHNQITAVSYWSSIDVQIRIKAYIMKTIDTISDMHFLSRSDKKNALAISSFQSEIIDSYESVARNYQKVLKSKNLSKRPDYWGGFSFFPFYFEFWEGHESRINRRECYELKEKSWKNYFLNP